MLMCKKSAHPLSVLHTHTHTQVPIQHNGGIVCYTMQQDIVGGGQSCGWNPLPILNREGSCCVGSRPLI